ncbi:MAG: thioredoxin [Clostridiales Family XIII bacterium]|jgi:thioredoxin 1|nr:thioredoxin [Clostridiales Family XIII bacterium]
MSELLVLTEENYEKEIAAPEPMVVDFYADWCMPCKAMAPVFDRVAGEYGGRVRFAKIDVDQSKQLAIKNKVLSIPTLLFFKGGEVADRVSGPIDAVQLKNRIDALL